MFDVLKIWMLWILRILEDVNVYNLVMVLVDLILEYNLIS